MAPFDVGDGASTSSAHIITNNSLQVLDNSQLKITNGNNYLKSNAGNFQGGSTSYNLSGNKISCNHGAVTGYANNCTSGYVYGCATMNSSGAAACIILALVAPELTAHVSGQQVFLSWQTKKNSDVDHFLVQRSANGYDWTLVGEVFASDQSSYSIKDPLAIAGINYYRLQQVDKDGRALYSSISSIKLAAAGETSIFPNPIKGHTFSVKTQSTDAVLLKVFSISGQPLLLSALKGQTRYTVTLPATLVPNTYILIQVIGNGRTQTFTVLQQ